MASSTGSYSLRHTDVAAAALLRLQRAKMGSGSAFLPLEKTRAPERGFREFRKTAKTNQQHGEIARNCLRAVRS